MPAPAEPVILSADVRRDLDAGVERFLAAAPAGGRISVWLGDTAGRPAYARDAESLHYAASTMKLPMLVAAYRRAWRGEVDLDRPVPVRNRFTSALDGSPYALDAEEDEDAETWARQGEQVPLRHLLRRAIVRSGNLATNLVLDHVGVTEVAAVLAEAGCTAAVVARGIEDAAAREAGIDNVVTARDLAAVLAGVAARTLGPEGMCAAVEEVLAAQEFRAGVPAGVPDGVLVAGKTGWVTGVAHDVALVRPPDAAPYVLAVCTTASVPRADAEALMAELSGLAWAGWVR